MRAHDTTWSLAASVMNQTNWLKKKKDTKWMKVQSCTLRWYEMNGNHNIVVVSTALEKNL